MKKHLLIGLSAAALLAASPLASAHRMWIKPTTTVVSGENEWISFDGAIANGIFTPDHYPMPVDRLTATAPSGKTVQLQHQQQLKYRSVFDLELTEKGTYKVASASNTLMARWTDDNGERHMWPGRGKTGTLEEFKQQVPANADVAQTSRKIEVFVTAGAPSDSVLKNTGEGLEMVAHTHPNDAYTGEDIIFGFTIDGEKAVGASVVVVKEGEKYRDNNDDIKLTTDEKGNITLNVDEPGMYWLEAEYEDNKAKAPASKRMGTYITTIEVLPL